ncbi:MAG: transposase [Chloroflexi bacterium]|nr:transposase [Chloroflexota bacterium]
MFQGKYRIPAARLSGWDYTSAGLYFVTICTQNREPWLGDIVDGEVRLSAIGEIVAEEWQKTAHIRPNVTLDAWIIMPNHLHGIIAIAPVETPRRGVSTSRRGVLQPNSLGSIIGQFKSVCTKRIWAAGFRDFAWQTRFYDHIIRDEASLQRIRHYILDNPCRWAEDKNHVDHLWI